MSPPVATTQLKREASLEPGVIPVFRRLMLFVFGLASLGIFTAFAAFEKLPVHYATIFTWLLTGGLFLHLSNRWFANRHPHAHFTIALLSITIVPVVSEYVGNALYLWRVGGSAPLITSAGLYLWLVIPLLLISTQYGMRTVALFIFGTTVLSVTLAFEGLRYLGIPPDVALGNAFVRLLIFTFIGYIVTRLSQSQRRLRRELIEKTQQIAEYAARMEELAIVRERNRMARELHDTLAHTLSAVEVQLKVLDMLIQQNPDNARKQLREIHTLTRGGLSEARRALHDLRARPIEEFGLLLALERLAERAADRTGAEAVIALPRNPPPLTSEQQQQLYRIVEEALNNVVRHACANRFWLTMTITEHQVTVIIKDNGIGFDIAALPAARYGVQGMRERAAMMHAQLQFISAPDLGTEVHVQVGVTL